MRRYSELDAIRGIAVLMVVFFHYTFRYGQIYPDTLQMPFQFKLGQYGVQLFFIVSGFVIFLTLNKTKRISDFVVSRFSRLYPAYWFSVILTFTIVMVFSLPGREVNFQSALINLTMFQEWFNVSNVDGVYWTLSVELSFYIIMSLLFVTKQIKRINTICVYWLLLIIVLNYLERNNIFKVNQLVALFFLLKYGNLFIAGIMFYRIMHNKGFFSYIILLLSLFVEFYLYGKLVFLVAAYYFLFLMFSKGYLRFLSIKPLMFFGNISYSLYLIHQNIGYIIINHLNQMNDVYYLNQFSIIFIPFIVSVIIATLMQRHIERPSLSFIRCKLIGNN